MFIIRKVVNSQFLFPHQVPGIHYVLVALLAEKAEIRFNPEQISVQKIVDAVESMGFEAEAMADAQCPRGECVLMVRIIPDSGLRKSSYGSNDFLID